MQKFDEHLFVMLKNVLHARRGRLVLGETFLYIGDGWLLTVQRGNGGEPPDLPELLEEAPAHARVDTMPAAYTIMAEVVDGYASAAAPAVKSALERTRGAGLQRERERGPPPHLPDPQGHRPRRPGGVEHRCRAARAPGISRRSPSAASASCPTIRDILDDAAGTAALINNQSKGLDAILSSYENNVAARQNQDMRTISAFATSSPCRL